MSASQIGALERLLWPKGARRDIWMIVDGARDRRIFGMLLEYFYSEHSCLFSGPLAPQLEVAAPYLIHLSYDDPKTRRFLTQAWGNRWGVFIKCDQGLRHLRRHLRNLLMVRDPGGNALLFRYYDPRVLRLYLPTCTREELEVVYGDIECFWMEGDEPSSALSLAYDRTALQTENIPLASTTQ